jgi:hypothetical protein
MERRERIMRKLEKEFSFAGFDFPKYLWTLPKGPWRKRLERMRKPVTGGYYGSPPINGRSGTHKGYIWKRADGAAPKVMRTSIAKPVIAYHADMSEFRSWPSVREAAEDIGCVVGSINACLAGHFKTYKGYVWKRPASIDAKPSPAMTARKLHSAQAVAAYDMTGVEAHKFISAAEAGRSLGISAAHITKCCNGTRKSAGGFTWKKI